MSFSNVKLVCSGSSDAVCLLRSGKFNVQEIQDQSLWISWPPEDEADRLSRNVGKHLPLHVAQQPTRAQISSTSRRKPVTALALFCLQQMSTAVKHDSRQQFQLCLFTTTHYKQSNRRRSIVRRAI